MVEDYLPCNECARGKHHTCLSKNCNCSCEGGTLKGTIAFDYDGTIHSYEYGWHDGTCYGTPIPGAFDVMQSYWDEGFDLIVFSCRNQPDLCQEWFDKWMSDGGYTFKIKEITTDKPVARLYYDDRGVGFRGNWTKAKAEGDRMLELEDLERLIKA